MFKMDFILMKSEQRDGLIEGYDNATWSHSSDLISQKFETNCVIMIILIIMIKQRGWDSLS